MGKVIEVYIKSEEALVLLTQPDQTRGFHYCTGQNPYKTEKVTSESDSLVLKTVKEVSKTKGLEVKQYDISTFKGRIKALGKGIKNTPTIVVGEEKIEGLSEIEKYLSELVKKL